MKTGVLVHGCNLNIENWRHVAWGDPPGQLGRIPQGILVAHQFNADTIVFGTGASSKEFRLGRQHNGDAASEDSNGGRKLLEAEYSLEYLRQHFDSLRTFKAFQESIPETSSDQEWAKLRESLLSRIVLDIESQNTIEEIKSAAELFLEAGIQQVILVSSPSHVVRCLRDATSIFANDQRMAGFQHRLLASPSITCYEGTVPNDVVVVEPPHRPDRHVVPTHRRIQRMLTLQKLNHDDLVQLIEEFDDLLQRYEHKYFNES